MGCQLCSGPSHFEMQVLGLDGRTPLTLVLAMLSKVFGWPSVARLRASCGSTSRTCIKSTDHYSRGCGDPMISASRNSRDLLPVHNTRVMQKTPIPLNAEHPLYKPVHLKLDNSIPSSLSPHIVLPLQHQPSAITISQHRRTTRQAQPSTPAPMHNYNLRY